MPDTRTKPLAAIERSMDESVRFVVRRTLKEEAGRVRCVSSFVKT